jgi:PPOX class probable F420-dependent enzyme
MANQTTVPDELVDLVTTNRIAHVTSIRPDGDVATYLMWIDWDGEHVLTSSPLGSVKARNWRANPRVTVSVVDRDDPWRYVVVRGRVVEMRPDEGLAFIDKMSQRYLGIPYRRRDFEREVFVIQPDHIRVGHGAGPRPSS